MVDQHPIILGMYKDTLQTRKPFLSYCKGAIKNKDFVLVKRSHLGDKEFKKFHKKGKRSWM
jgi:hypothetical protein